MLCKAIWTAKKKQQRVLIYIKAWLALMLSATTFPEYI